MAAKNLHRKNGKGSYSHIYNKGVEKRILFNDAEDYEVFKGFLQNYLTAPQDPESIKQVFTVHGRIFRGMPHQPKNYFNKVGLIAYSLMPNHFSLLLHQKTRGSIESFIRSLCTRYSMYFNKKYRRTGSLFEGPYKSIQINDKLLLLHLTRYLHHASGFTSYAEYLGTRVTPWIKSQVVLAILDKKKGGYKEFVEKYASDQEGKELIKNLIFDYKSERLERRNLTRNITNPMPEMISKTSKNIPSDRIFRPSRRVPEYFAAAIVFIFLLALGIRNVLISTIENTSSNLTPEVLSESTVVEEVSSPSASPILSESTVVEEVSSPSASPALPRTSTADNISSASAEIVKPKIMLTISTAQKSAIVNIRQKPTTKSETIGKTKNGDTFEFVSINSGWYEVKLATGATGFISAELVQIGDINNQ